VYESEASILIFGEENGRKNVGRAISNMNQRFPGTPEKGDFNKLGSRLGKRKIGSEWVGWNEISFPGMELSSGDGKARWRSMK